MVVVAVVVVVVVEAERDEVEVDAGVDGVAEVTAPADDGACTTTKNSPNRRVWRAPLELNAPRVVSAPTVGVCDGFSAGVSAVDGSVP